MLHIYFIFNSSSTTVFLTYLHLQAREMEKRKEGRPGEARAALRRSVRDNVYVFFNFFL